MEMQHLLTVKHKQFECLSASVSNWEIACYMCICSNTSKGAVHEKTEFVTTV